MKPREAVAQVFRFEETRPVPYFVWIHDEICARLDNYYASPSWRTRSPDYFYGRHFGFGECALSNGLSRDPFGVIAEHGNITHVVKHPLEEPTLRGYSWPDPEKIEDWDRFRTDLLYHPHAFRCAGLGYGLFERAWLLRGMETLLEDMVERPDFVEQLLDAVLDFHLAAMDIAVRRLPLDAYFGGDDWADQRGPMMGVERWRRFIKPRLAKLIARSHEHGLPYVCHSCGNVAPLLDDLLEIGLDGLESLQPEAMDVFDIKRRCAGRMVLIGGMGVQSTMPFGTSEDVIYWTQRLLVEMGRGGGYIFSTAKPIMADVPTENIIVLLEMLWSQ